MDYSGYQQLRIEPREHGVLLVTINRPERINATDAQAVLDTALEVADRIATGPQVAARWTKRTLNHWLRAALPAFDASVAYEMLTFMGDDVREGARAIAERREPRFDPDR
jgi:enoyl-CoA hydratase/carnithine racemase